MCTGLAHKARSALSGLSGRRHGRWYRIRAPSSGRRSGPSDLFDPSVTQISDLFTQRARHSETSRGLACSEVAATRLAVVFASVRPPRTQERHTIGPVCAYSTATSCSSSRCQHDRMCLPQAMSKHSLLRNKFTSRRLTSGGHGCGHPLPAHGAWRVVWRIGRCARGAPAAAHETGLAAIGGGFERVVSHNQVSVATLQPMQLIEPHASDHLSSVWCVCACAAWLIALMNPVSLLTLRCVRSLTVSTLPLLLALLGQAHRGGTM